MSTLVMRNKQIATETLVALGNGYYHTSTGKHIDLTSLTSRCVEGTRCYTPTALAHLREQVLDAPLPYALTHFEVVNETTLEGCAALVGSGPFKRVGALNFASARNPGGGFLEGAQAQEESLARSSGLYQSLIRCPEYYQFHRQQTTSLYSDRMIYSPVCPIFRTDDGDWLETPYVVDFITSPAPNAGAIRRNEPQRVKDIELTLHERISKILTLAAAQGCEALVLGAWGCGVFANDPQLVAAVFGAALHATGPFWRRFEKVRFSVWDRSFSKLTLKAFETVFGST